MWQGPLNEHDAPHEPYACEFCGVVSSPTRHSWFRIGNEHAEVTYSDYTGRGLCWAQQIAENRARMAAEKAAKKRKPVRASEPVQLELFDLQTA